MAGTMQRVGSGWAWLGVVIAFGSTASCDDGCDEGTTNVCDENGENCFCATDCEDHTDCAAGEYCLEEDVCVGAYEELTQLGCGQEGQDCCTVHPDATPAGISVCVQGLRCDSATTTCVR